METSKSESYAAVASKNHNPVPQHAPGAATAIGHEAASNSIPLSIFPVAATDKFW